VRSEIEYNMSRAYIIKLGCKGVRGLSPLDWMEKKV